MAPIKELLVTELAALKARVERATKSCEQKIVASQYGQRIEHLIERIKEIPDPKPAAAPAATPAPAPPATPPAK